MPELKSPRRSHGKETCDLPNLAVVVKECAVRSLECWSAEDTHHGTRYDVCVILRNSGITLLQDGHPEKHITRWDTVGFGGQTICCTSLTDSITKEHPAVLTFQYRMNNGKKTLVQISTSSLPSAIDLLHAFRMFLPHLRIEAPSAWPLPELTMRSKRWLQHYTPFLRNLFRGLSVFNSFAMQSLMISAILHLLHVDVSIISHVFDMYDLGSWVVWLTSVWILLQKWLSVTRTYTYVTKLYKTWRATRNKKKKGGTFHSLQYYIVSLVLMLLFVALSKKLFQGISW